MFVLPKAREFGNNLIRMKKVVKTIKVMISKWPEMPHFQIDSVFFRGGTKPYALTPKNTFSAKLASHVINDTNFWKI